MSLRDAEQFRRRRWFDGRGRHRHERIGLRTRTNTHRGYFGTTVVPCQESQAYTMADGIIVDVDPTQPMPEAVLADITSISQATVNALPAENPSPRTTGTTASWR